MSPFSHPSSSVRTFMPLSLAIAYASSGPALKPLGRGNSMASGPLDSLFPAARPRARLRTLVTHPFFR